MKKLLAFLLALVSGHSKAADSEKLGSDADPIRRILFASQSLKEQGSQIHPSGTPDAFQSIVEAAKLVDEGKRKDAIVQLRTVLEMPTLESRVVLWAWTALRELGEKPDPQNAYEVLGVILEIPSGGANDTLAAYSDGSARYLNFSGKAIFWDQEDSKIKALCAALIASGIPASSKANPRTDLSLPKGGTQITLLTRYGNYAIANPPPEIINPGATLLSESIGRATA